MSFTESHMSLHLLTWIYCNGLYAENQTARTLYPCCELFAMVTALTVLLFIARQNCLSAYCLEYSMSTTRCSAKQCCSEYTGEASVKWLFFHWFSKTCYYTFLLVGPCWKPVLISSTKPGVTSRDTAASQSGVNLLSSKTDLFFRLSSLETQLLPNCWFLVFQIPSQFSILSIL